MTGNNSETKELTKTKNWVAILVLVLAAIVFGFLYWIVSDSENKNIAFILQDVLLALFTTLVSIIIVTIVYTIYTERQFKKSIREAIIDSLSADNDILKKYDKDSIIAIIKNSLITMLGKNLAGKFIVNVLQRQLDSISYRTDYRYEVSINEGDTPEYHKIQQTIEYRKNLKIKNKKNVLVACYFTFKEDPFREDHQNEIIFFREELTCREFYTDILEHKEDTGFILKALNFEFYLQNGSIFNRVLDADIQVEIIDNNKIKLTTKVTEDLIEQNVDDNFFSFCCKMKCEYPANKNDYFYVVFPEPTQDAVFRINFDRAIIKKEDVHNVSFVLSPNYETKQSDNSNSFVFERKRQINKEHTNYNTIFPHSGIIFHW